VIAWATPRNYQKRSSRSTHYRMACSLKERGECTGGRGSYKLVDEYSTPINHSNLMQIASYPRISLWNTIFCRVIVLTCLVGTTSCSVLGRHAGEWCKTHAYVRTDLAGYINQRFIPNQPARIGVIPFEVQANLASRGSQMPGLGNQLTWAIHRRLLETEVFPIIEVLNREDWPRKREQFFTGNFGALRFAADAGYDMVVVGYLEPLVRLDTWTVHTKLIEVSSGTTLWYGTSTVYTMRPDMLEVSSRLGLTDRRPDILNTNELTEEIAKCIAYDMTHDPEVD
jgi:hypothetical protein